jgi:hypothetical protein
MSYPFELVRSQKKDTLWSGLSQRHRTEGASDKGEFEFSLDVAKEVS